MNEPVLLLGLAVGMRHAMEGDHVAAVATLVARDGGWKRNLCQGAAWGLGHTVSLLAVCSAVLLLGLVVPETAARWLETAAGAMLIALGLDLLGRRRRASAAGRFPRRALLVGMVHGMAGSAALIVLTAQSAGSISAGLAYVSLFGAGSIAGMALLSAAMALPLRWSRRAAGLHRGLQATIAAASVTIGAALVWSQTAGAAVL